MTGLRKLGLPDFADFVHEVHGHRPYPWQHDYLRKVADCGAWPDLDIPTGLGKTSLVDIWAFLLAWQTVQEVPRTAALRLFFVVDRRLVVDQTYEHARRLVRALDAPPPGSVTEAVADGLRRVSHGGSPLEAVRMRGGVDWASRWLRDPAQPAVVSATVDQYGSRLLFRGYHTSAQMRPVDAALCGMDALLAVDEAHIARPLMATAADCATHQATASDRALAGRGVEVVSLSATAPASADRPRHSCGPADFQDAHAGARLHANRAVTLVDATGLAKDPSTAFARAAAVGVDAVLSTASRPVAAVVANTVRSARAAYRTLAARSDLDVLLLTGRCRPADRDRLLNTLWMQELLVGVADDRDRPLVVVATQTFEVGLDVSVSGMVTENASLAALVQRLGRVNRAGKEGRAAVVVVQAQAPRDPATAPVYGNAAVRTWDWLTDHAPRVDAEPHLKAGELAEHLADGRIINPTTLPDLLDGKDRGEFDLAPPRVPVLHGTLLDSWARTSPTPVPDQPPSPFLHGLDPTEPDVRVLWRGDLRTGEGQGDGFRHWQSCMMQTPPRPHECVELPLRQVRRFLAGERKDVDTISDLEGTPAPDDGGQTRSPSMRPVLRWDAENDQWLPVTHRYGIRPGSLIAVPAAYGGHDSYGWTGTTGTPVADVADLCPETPGRALRLDSDVLATLVDLDDDTRTRIDDAVTAACRTLKGDDDEHPPGETVRELLTELDKHLESVSGHWGDQLRERLTAMRDVQDWTVLDDPAGAPAGSGSRPRANRAGHAIPGDADVGRLVLVPPPPRAGHARFGVGRGDADSDSSSLTRPVTLSDHSRAVAERADASAAQLGLPAETRKAVRLAAEAHDCAKTHPRFQARLCGGDHLRAEALPEPLAKSGMDPRDRAARRRADRLARWPSQLRHEALSAHAVQAWVGTRPDMLDGLDTELLVHLVASHHGHARPLLPPVSDPQPTPVLVPLPDGSAVKVDSGAMGVDWQGPDRFTALNHRYGSWGLALLEAVVRLADMACSEEGT